jgi:hypothetical protein
MKFFDFGVEIIYGYGASVLLMKETCHSGVKKLFYQKKSSIIIFSIFDFGAVIFFAYIKGQIAQLFY